MTTTSTVKAAVSPGTNLLKYKDVPFGRSATPVVVLPVTDLRTATGLIPTVTELAGSINLVLAANVLLAQGEICDNETEASVCIATVVLPRQYKTGTPLTLRIPCTIVKTGAAVDDGSTVDASVYRQASGAVGSDLVTTAAATFVALDTWYNKDFTIAGASLAPGDALSIKVTSNIVDSEAGGGTLRFNMDALQLLGIADG